MSLPCLLHLRGRIRLKISLLNQNDTTYLRICHIFLGENSTKKHIDMNKYNKII